MLLEHAIKCLISLLVSLCKDYSGCWHNTGMSSHPSDHTCDSAPSKHILYWYCDLVFVHLLMFCLEHWWMPRDELSLMALQTNRSILILVCTSWISIPEASTPNLLIVQDLFMSLLRAPIAFVWEVDVDSFNSCKLLVRFIRVVQFCDSP
jgi:hypothetical protein